jgi:hypothetical protein
MTTSIPKWLEPRAALPGGRVPAIPQTIFQTFERVEVPDRMAEAAATWSELNPAFAYRFFDAEDRRAFIAAHFDSRTLEAYERIEGGAFRADFWRYCVLVVHGGIYVDADSTCEVGLLSFLDDDDVFVAARAGHLPWGVYNGFISAVPRHPFLERAIARATGEILRMRPGDEFDGYTITGPGNLGMAMNACLGRRRKAPFEWGRQQKDAFRYRLLRKMTKRPERSGHLLDGETLVLWTEYPEYREDIASTGSVHWTSTLRKRGLFERAVRKARRIGRRFV